ncbi:MAG TPA: hybrid sensor histidine kinase/response regulator [Oscillatoriaceae cyanobacterium M33_DOE_052]|uniref:histidine kinase n=1 Tax=Planktothricoides sp. SpSt-374 TaxID=2282167 RepID=A0A7C3VGD6_9CYAN|nr:hybrid sensor histidine kinase/response regulator [Oscillatoriaceae cyanobacterium M33_DOE_052]
MNSRTESGKGNILIVDDTPNNLRVLSTMLLEQGYEVRTALNGNMALQSVKVLLPELILLDIQMPDMDGYQLCQRLKNIEEIKDIPVIFISALDDVNNKVKAFTLGGVDYITKPFHVEEVIARVENHLLNRRLQQQLQQSEMLARSQSEELSRALNNLQRAQSQLIQSEKMSSLEHLVAGIAHEINNPINFIYGNISHVTEYTNSLFKIIDVYSDLMETVPTEVKEIIEDVELDFIRTDLPEIMGSMRAGAERIREIVEVLRNYSRLDESGVKAVDIHEGINSALMILQHRLQETLDRPEIEVVKQYEQLPKVECYAGLLNQVFMSALVNAIDAIETKFNLLKKSGHSEAENMAEKDVDFFTETGLTDKSLFGSISVSTHLIKPKDMVCIVISDNGAGMTDEVKQHLFEPFFTTKAVGKGRGLGMWISYQVVVEQHKGNIRCLSEPGEGTKLVIEIPIHQPEAL